MIVMSKNCMPLEGKCVGVGGSGQNGDKWGLKETLLWGDGYTMQCVDDDLLSCILEPYMVL